jgi:hypothetical protein
VLRLRVSVSMIMIMTARMIMTVRMPLVMRVIVHGYSIPANCVRHAMP